MQEVLVSKIFNYTSTPTKNVEGQFWFNPSTNVLSRFNGTVWKPITVSSDDVAVLTDGNKVSLTNYLNTQIAALAEGIDSKQDKLSYYSENTTTNKASFNIDGKSTGTSEFSINVTDSVGDNSGNSVINLTAERVSNGAGEINLKASGSSGGKITLSTINGASIENTGIELNVPFKSDHESNIGNNSGIIFNGPISGTGITKTITDVDYRLPTSKAVKTELDKKQDQLAFYHEETSTNQEASIAGADSFSILSTNKGLILDGNNGGITIKNSNFNSGQAVISLDSNSWKNSSDPILFSVDGENIKISDALLISEIKNKQNSTDETLNTTDKTITGSINELKTSVDNKQNSLQYYSEDTLKSVSKLSSNRLEVNCYDESGTTYNPFILRNENGIAIGGSESYGGKGVLTNIGKGYINLETPGGTTILNYESLEIEGTGESTFKVLTHPSDSDFTSSKINVSAINSFTYDVLLSLKDDKVNISSATVGSITPSAFTSTNAQTLICADAFAIKPTTKTLFGFNNSAYNISTNRYAGLFYLKNTDANSTGISINPDNIILSDYNNYSSSNEGTYFAATEIDKGRISLQKRTNGSSEFIDSGYINPDSIKLHNGKFGSAYDRTSDIIITASRNSSDAPNFHGIAYKGADSTDAQWFIGRTVDGDNPFEGQPTVSKPYIKGFANAEFSEKVQATTIQAGKEVSSSSGVATLTESGINFNTPAGTATYAYNGIDISNAFFKVVGGSSNPYVQIPDNNGSNFKIWKGTETEFKALTAVNSDTVYLRVQENNRIKATVGADTASLENITDSYTLSSASFTSFITDTKYNNAQGSILITPSLTNSGALIFGENITDTSKGFPLYPDNIVSIPFKNITNFKVAGSINDSFNYIVSFDI